MKGKKKSTWMQRGLAEKGSVQHSSFFAPFARLKQKAIHRKHLRKMADKLTREEIKQFERESKIDNHKSLLSSIKRKIVEFKPIYDDHGNMSSDQIQDLFDIINDINEYVSDPLTTEEALAGFKDAMLNMIRQHQAIQEFQASPQAVTEAEYRKFKQIVAKDIIVNIDEFKLALAKFDPDYMRLKQARDLRELVAIEGDLRKNVGDMGNADLTTDRLTLDKLSDGQVEILKSTITNVLRLINNPEYDDNETKEKLEGNMDMILNADKSEMDPQEKDLLIRNIMVASVTKTLCEALDIPNPNEGSTHQPS